MSPQTVLRQDDVEGIGKSLKGRLVQQLPGILENRYQTLNGENGTDVPSFFDLDPGASDVVRDLLTESGEAMVGLGSESSDIPLIDVGMGEDANKILIAVAGFTVSIQEAWSWEFAGRPIRPLKIRTATRAIAEKINGVIYYGAPQFGVTGFVNDPNVTLELSSTNPYTLTSADDLISFFFDPVTGIVNQTNLVEAPNVVLVPPTLHEKLLKTRLSNTNMNVKNYILENSTYIQRIEPRTELRSAELEAAGVHSVGTNQDRMLVYPATPDVLECHRLQLDVAPIEYRNMKYYSFMYAKSTGAIWKFPKAARYVQFARAT
jgi:hypothetical protein